MTNGAYILPAFFDILIKISHLSSLVSVSVVVMVLGIHTFSLKEI